jgi:hypothetical protein
MPARTRKTSAVAEADAAARALRAVGGRTGKVGAAELAEFLHRSQQTLANWRWQDKGPRYVGKGRGILYDWADVGEWLVSLPSGGEDIHRGAA